MSTPVAPAESFTPLTPAPVTGGKRSRKLKLVTRKQARKILKKLGRKMRGGQPTDPVVVPAAATEDKSEGAMGGRKTRRRRGKRSLFGLKY